MGNGLILLGANISIQLLNCFRLYRCSPANGSVRPKRNVRNPANSPARPKRNVRSPTKDPARVKGALCRPTKLCPRGKTGFRRAAAAPGTPLYYRRRPATPQTGTKSCRSIYDLLYLDKPNHYCHENQIDWIKTA